MMTPPQVMYRVQRAARAANRLSESAAPSKADVARGARRAISSTAGAVLDDDAAGVLVMRDAVDVLVDAAGDCFEADGAFSFGVRLKTRPLANVTVTRVGPAWLPRRAERRRRARAHDDAAHVRHRAARVQRDEAGAREATAVRRAAARTAVSLSRDFASARRRACARRAPRDARAAARALGSFRVRPPYKIRDS